MVRAMSSTDRQLLCIECSALIRPREPALCVATPELVGCLCARCLEASSTREAAVARLWRRLREACADAGEGRPERLGPRRGPGPCGLTPACH